MPIGALGLIGLGFALAGTRAALGPQRVQLRRTLQADNFGLFITVTLIVVGVLTIALSGPTIEREGLPAGEYYALTLFAIAGMMMMATATDLLLIFLALEILSLAVYVLTGMRRDVRPSTEGGVQVLPARRLLERVLPLRHRAHLRAHRQHAASTASAAAWRRRHERQPHDAVGGRPAARRLRLQGLGRAVPHVDARRLRGRADGGHRLHVDGREGGGLCRVRARVPLRARAAARRLDAGALGARHR